MIYLKNWIRAERSLAVEKFKRSLVIVNMAKQQYCAFPLEDESSLKSSVNELDFISAVDSDVASVHLKSKEASDDGTAMHYR
jgi:hypothetical protein